MSKQALNYFVLPSQAIAANAATPNPGIVGVSIWSTVANAELVWNGTSWQLGGATLTATAPASLTATTSTPGALSTAARGDHRHAHGVQSVGAHHDVATGSVGGFLSSTNFTKLAGVAANASATTLSATTPLDITTAAAMGVATTVSAADHVHSHGLQTLGTLHGLATGSVAGFMASADFTKLVAVAEGATAPQTLGGGPTPLALDGSAGVLTTASRENHTHMHGVFSDETLHALASDTQAGFMTAADFTKLAGIATGATALLFGSNPTNVAPATSVLGVATTTLPDDHVHAHGVQSTSTHHAVATGSVPGFLTAANFTKLAGIADGATTGTLSNSIPVPISTVGDAGLAASASRSDHVHIHAVGVADGAAHALATASTDGFVSSTQQDKINAITAATAGAGVANAGMTPYLAATTGGMNPVYLPTVDTSGVQDIVRFMNLQSASYARNIATTGLKLNVLSLGKTSLLARGGGLPGSLVANSRATKLIQGSLAATRYQFDGYKLNNTQILHNVSAAGTYSGVGALFSDITFKGHPCKQMTMSATINNYTSYIAHSSMGVTRAKGFYVIISFISGGPSGAILGNGSDASFIGLGPVVVISTTASTLNNTVGLAVPNAAPYQGRIQATSAAGAVTVGTGYSYTTTFDTTNYYELHLYANPNNTTYIKWGMRCINPGAGYAAGVITTNLPAVSTVLLPQISVQSLLNSGVTPLPCTAHIGISVETPLV